MHFRFKQVILVLNYDFYQKTFVCTKGFEKQSWAILSFEAHLLPRTILSSKRKHVLRSLISSDTHKNPNISTGENETGFKIVLKDNDGLCVVYKKRFIYNEVVL